MAVDHVMTPKVMGGLGLGETGKTGGSWIGGEIKVSRVRISSSFFYSGIPKRVARRCLTERFGLLMPMPVSPAQYKLEKSLVSEHLSEWGCTTIPKCAIKKGGLRDTWVCDDTDAPLNDPWNAKMWLEWGLKTRTLEPKYVPDSRVRESPMGFRRAASLLSRWKGRSLNLEKHDYGAEPFACVSDFGNQLWAGYLNYVIGTGMSNKLDTAWIELASYCWRSVVNMKPVWGTFV